MIVHCISFGNLWWLRPGSNDLDPAKFASRAAIFNTTGFKQGARERRNWTIPGVVRLNAGTCSEQRVSIANMGPGRFDTPGLERHGSQNRLLLRRKVKGSTPADMVLICLNSRTLGRIAFDGAWRSLGIRVVAASAFQGEQETLILMPLLGQITTERGTWGLEWNDTRMAVPAFTMISAHRQTEV